MGDEKVKTITAAWLEVPGIVTRGYAAADLIFKDGTAFRVDQQPSDQMLEESRELLEVVLRTCPDFTPAASVIADCINVLFMSLRNKHSNTHLEQVQGLPRAGKRSREAHSADPFRKCCHCDSALVISDLMALPPVAQTCGWLIRRLVSRIRLIARRNQVSRSPIVEKLKQLVIIRPRRLTSATLDKHMKAGSAQRSNGAFALLLLSLAR